MLSIIVLSLRDFLHPKILLLSLLPITAAAFFWGLIFYVFSGQIEAALISLLGHIPFMDSDWVVSAIEFAGGIFIYYQLLIITAVMIVGLIADQVVDRVNRRHYQLEKTGFGSLNGSLISSLKSNLVFILLLILTLPLIFVPVLNIIVNLWLWMVLIKNPLFYDSIAMYATREEFQTLKNSNRFGTFSVALLSASLFLIPVIGVFIYVLQLLFFAHLNLQRLELLRSRLLK